MCKELFFHHGRIPVQTLSHPTLSRQVMGSGAGATSRCGLPGRSCGLSHWACRRGADPRSWATAAAGAQPGLAGWPEGQKCFSAGGSLGSIPRWWGWACGRFLLTSPSAGHQDTAPRAVYRPVNEPQLWGRLEMGQRPFCESWQGSGLLETGREDKQRGESCELFPGKPALYAHSPWPCILEESLFPTLYIWGD